MENSLATDASTLERLKREIRGDFEAGSRALGAGDGASAIACFEAVLAAHPRDASAQVHLARARAG